MEPFSVLTVIVDLTKLLYIPIIAKVRNCYTGYLFILFKKNKINPLCDNLLTYFYGEHFSPKQNFTMHGLILCFANHSNIWFDRRKLDIHICAFCLLWANIECDFVKLHCILLRELEYKGQIMTYYYGNNLYFMDPLKMSQGTWVVPRPVFENCCSRVISLSRAAFHIQWPSAISHSFSWKSSHLLTWMLQWFSLRV